MSDPLSLPTSPRENTMTGRILWRNLPIIRGRRLGGGLQYLDLTRFNRPGATLFIFFAVLALIWTASFFGGSTKHLLQPLPQSSVTYAQSWLDRGPHTKSSIFNLSHLNKYVQTAEFSYARRTIRTKYYKGDRPDTTRVHENLILQPLLVLEKSNLLNITLDTTAELILEVPRSPAVDLTSMSFGMATQPSRFAEATPQIMHWLNNTGAQLHILAPPSAENAIAEEELRDLGLNVTITPDSMVYAKRYFGILRTLYEHRTPTTKWLVYMDDDTFIPSLPHLIQHFNKHYEPADEVMVAAITDNANQLRQVGLIPFGGGGIFVSVPLAAALLKPTVFAACLANDVDFGDQIVNDCLNNYSKVRPTWDLGLNQMDVHGDVSGIYESGRRMLTVHHWHSWYTAPIPAIANVSRACGQECVLQRFQFDDDVVLANGYSIAEYLGGIEGEDGVDEGVGVDLASVERTWTDDQKQSLHHIGPLRDPLRDGWKRQLRMVETVVDESGKGMRQTYFEGAGKESGVDRVVELLWLF